MTNRKDLECFHTAFSADDTVMDFVPNFDMAKLNSLHSTKTPVGPFVAGVSTQVPLWLALHLEAKSLGTLVAPTWWNVSNFQSIIQYEQTHSELYKDETTLPHNYYPLGMRLCRIGGSNSSGNDSAGGDQQAVALLLEDLLECRIDKLRQQFQDLLIQTDNSPENLDLVVNVTGIGTQELALLRDFVQQALQDRTWLLQQTQNQNEQQPLKTPVSTGGETIPISDEAYNKQPQAATTGMRKSVRRFRR